MHLRILGPLEVWTAQGERIHVSGVKRRALLATLVIQTGQAVSIPRLITELWGPAPPAGAVNALQAHIVRLRKALSTEPDRLVTHPTGYTLYADTDAKEFTHLVTAARHSPDPAPQLRKALSLWRGPALDGCVAGDICAAEASALEEVRLTAMETLYEASLRAGHHAEVIADLTEATTAFPLRERFYAQLMEALCRAGRQADALAVYDRARKRFITELGAEPGPALRARVQSIKTPAPTGNDLTREVAELQHKIDALVTRQAELLQRLQEQHPKLSTAH